ncbi:MAG TPA: sigma factor, partial [Terriglobia bacterium]|nr:sigma factor [Terriglobia bacterium]
MATQSITTFEQIGNAAPAPSLRRPLLARRSLLPVRAQTPVPHGPKPAGQNHRALVEMLPMVKRMAFKIREHLPTHVDVDDLMGNGVLGLVDAVAKFDSAKRVKLESYARHRVRGGILDGLRRTDP